MKSYSWIDTKAMTADILTKEGSDIENMLEVIRKGVFRKAHSCLNMVIFKDGEMMMVNTSLCEDRFDQECSLDQKRTGGQ